MLKFEYECWKCPKWHETKAKEAAWVLRNAYARPAVSIGRLRLTIPAKLYWAWYQRVTARNANR